MVEEEREAAGHTPIDGVARRDGEGGGWIALVVDERSETYLIEYSRSGAEVIGSDETIDEFTTQFEIPAPCPFLLIGFPIVARQAVFGRGHDVCSGRYSGRE